MTFVIFAIGAVHGFVAAWAVVCDATGLAGAALVFEP
jgi:hypothetical protein